VRRADARVRIETTRTFAFDLQLGVYAAGGNRFDGQRFAIERDTGVASIDPLDARITALVMHDL
jgi:hypothetical protein